MTPTDIFAKLHAASGAKLFTITLLDRDAGVAWRAYTSHPEDYPVTGTKPMIENGWAAQVLGRGETFVANDTAGFAKYFSDHAVINALGCEAAVNLPVSDGDLVQGTVNILDVAGHFTPTRVAELEALIAEARSDLLNAFNEIREAR